MGFLKKNVDQFNRDVSLKQGYRYTTEAPYSAQVANLRMTQATLDRIPLETQTLLDVGCGDGSYTEELRKARPEIKITGVDAAFQAIELASAKYPLIHFFVGDVMDPSIFRGHFDLAVVRGLLHHTQLPEKVIQHVAMAASRCIIIEPNGNNPLLKLIEKISPYHRAHEERSFSSKALKSWCQKSGLKITHLDYIGFVPFFFPTFLAKVIYFVQPIFENIPAIKHFLSAQIVIVCEADLKKTAR